MDELLLNNLPLRGPEDKHGTLEARFSCSTLLIDAASCSLCETVTAWVTATVNTWQVARADARDVTFPTMHAQHGASLSSAPCDLLCSDVWWTHIYA